jgi:uncharacterized protein
MAKELKVEDLASSIREAGFQCLRCGECCTGEDNSVMAFPSEIRRIMTVTGKAWLEVAEPPKEGEVDVHGNFHTLEWRLRKAGPSCRFYNGCRCLVYEVKPILCSTYPFYLDLEDGQLYSSECKGLGKEISLDGSLKLARTLKNRCIFDLEEALTLVKKYEDFERGCDNELLSGFWIIHDSEGAHRIAKRNIDNHKYK